MSAVYNSSAQGVQLGAFRVLSSLGQSVQFDAVYASNSTGPGSRLGINWKSVANQLSGTENPGPLAVFRTLCKTGEFIMQKWGFWVCNSGASQPATNVNCVGLTSGPHDSMQGPM